MKSNLREGAGTANKSSPAIKKIQKIPGAEIRLQVEGPKFLVEIHVLRLDC